MDGEPVGFLFLARNVWAFLVSGNWSLVRLERSLPRHQVRPFLVKSLQELPKGTINVVRILYSALRHLTGVLHSLVVHTDKDHLLCLAG